MNSLGELSEGGMGIPQDYQPAQDWYKKAADLGNADAMHNLGAMLENGRGYRRTYRKPNFGTSEPPRLYFPPRSMLLDACISPVSGFQRTICERRVCLSRLRS